MEVYLLRHAIAVDSGTPGYPNDDRPLTPDGVKKMEEAARGMAELMDMPDVILTSPMSRTRETAEIAARALKCEERVVKASELKPGASAHDGFSLIMTHRDKKRIMLVGHEPTISRLATYLLGGNRSVIEFKKGALCRIDLTPSAPREPGNLVFLLPPKILRAVAPRRRRTA